jgi:hypothetical protein
MVHATRASNATYAAFTSPFDLGNLPLNPPLAIAFERFASVLGNITLGPVGNLGIYLGKSGYAGPFGIRAGSTTARERSPQRFNLFNLLLRVTA